MTDQHLSPLEKAHERMRELRAAGYKPVQLNPVEKARANPRSLKLGIRAHCWICCGGDSDPGVKLRVRDCGLKEKCTLWVHRPWQTATGRVDADGIGVDADVEGDDDDIPEAIEVGINIEIDGTKE